MNSNISTLEELVLDEDLALPVRASVLIMIIINLGSIEDENHRKLIVDFHAQGIGLWYTIAVVSCLQNFSHEHSLSAKHIVEGMLKHSRSDFEARNCIEEILSQWRETSYAPVQKNHAQEEWLG